MRRCLIVEDEVMIRDVIADISSLEGWLVRSCDAATDIADRLHPPPHLIFLDIGLNRTDAVEAIDVLARTSFTGRVQIVSGHSLTIVHQIRAIGRSKGLMMMEPILKPFHSSDIQEALQKSDTLIDWDEENLLTTFPEIEWQSWIDPRSTKSVYCDGTFANPAQGDAWLAHGASYAVTEPPDPAAPWSIALPLTLDAASAFLNDEEMPKEPLTFVFSEEEAFRDIERSRSLFAKLGIHKIRVRVCDCAAQTFSLIGHRPFHVDEIVISSFLRSILCTDAGLRKNKKVAEIAARTGARLMASGVHPQASLKPFADAGIDLVQWASRDVANIRADAAELDPAVWRPISLAELQTARRGP